MKFVKMAAVTACATASLVGATVMSTAPTASAAPADKSAAADRQIATRDADMTLTNGFNQPLEIETQSSEGFQKLTLAPGERAAKQSRAAAVAFGIGDTPDSPYPTKQVGVIRHTDRSVSVRVDEPTMGHTGPAVDLPGIGHRWAKNMGNGVQIDFVRVADSHVSVFLGPSKDKPSTMTVFNKTKSPATVLNKQTGETFTLQSQETKLVDSNRTTEKLPELLVTRSDSKKRPGVLTINGQTDQTGDYTTRRTWIQTKLTQSGGQHLDVLSDNQRLERYDGAYTICRYDTDLTSGYHVDINK